MLPFGHINLLYFTEVRQLTDTLVAQWAQNSLWWFQADGYAELGRFQVLAFDGYTETSHLAIYEDVTAIRCGLAS